MTVGNKSEKDVKKARRVDGSLIFDSEKNATDGVMEIRLMTGKLFPSILTVGRDDTENSDDNDDHIQSEDNGRLGNQLCAYASLLVSIQTDLEKYAWKLYLIERMLLYPKCFKYINEV
jgi:hypothetical protein